MTAPSAGANRELFCSSCGTATIHVFTAGRWVCDVAGCKGTHAAEPVSPIGHIANEAHARELVPLVRPRWRLRALSETTPRNVRWLVPGLFPLRFLTLVAGIGGLGKSTYLLALAAEGSVAAVPWDTIIVSFEDTADETLAPRVLAAGGNLARVHELVLANTESLESFSLPRDVENLHALVRQTGARLVVLDPIVAAVDVKLDAYKDQHVRQVLAQLWRIAREEDCAVAMVGHLNRVPSTDAYLRIANSMAFWNAARSVVLVTEDGAEENEFRLVAQRKANLARLAPVERHQLEEIVLPDIVDPETGKPIVTSRMRFVEIADDVDASEILGAHAPTKTETAESLLEVLLASGEWRESKEVQRVLAAAGFNERLARRAAKDMGVEHERRGFPSATWWRLRQSGQPTVGTRLGSTDVLTVETAQPSGTVGTNRPVGTSRVEQSPTENGRPLIGDELYPLMLADAVRDGHLTSEADHPGTPGEAEQQLALHRLVEESLAP